jgi:hypothetical protein
LRVIAGGSSGRASARQEIHDDENDGDDESDVNEGAANMQDEANQPEDKQYDDDGPQQSGHVQLLSKRVD